MNVKSTASESFVKALPPNGAIDYRADWLVTPEADAIFETLRGEIDWQTRSITMFGRRIPQPRLLRFQGDPGIRYAYSGDTYTARDWHPAVAALRDRIERECDASFNCALLNLYRNGADSMGWHADDEPELGADPVIASISLGAVRRFVLRRRHDHGTRLEIRPAHGSLILMRGDLQHHWQHHVPRTRQQVDARINLTFRRILRR